jgi:hypothetical protein
MKVLNKFSVVGTLAVTITFGLVGPIVALAATSPGLGTADTYSILSGQSVTNTGTTTISGNVGIYPGAGDPNNYTGFDTVNLGGAINDANGAALTAKGDKNTAFSALGSQDCNTSYEGVKELAGETLVPGVYCASEFDLTSGTLTLNGDSSGVWIFKSTSSLVITGSSANVVFTGGGLACNVWWRVVSSASFGGGSSLVGNILAGVSITFADGASLNGRALAGTGIVTLIGNSITGPTCTVPTPTPTPNSSRGRGAGGSGLLPRIHVTKVPNPSALPSGPGSVAYTYKVTNVGSLAMSKVTLKDDKCSPVKFISGDRDKDSMLDLDEIWTYRCTTIVSETVTNTATAHGFAEGVDVYDTAKATVVVGGAPVPRFPNAGSGSDGNSGISWSIFIPAGIFVALL